MFGRIRYGTIVSLVIAMTGVAECAILAGIIAVEGMPQDVPGTLSRMAQVFVLLMAGICILYLADRPPVLAIGTSLVTFPSRRKSMNLHVRFHAYAAGDGWEEATRVTTQLLSSFVEIERAWKRGKLDGDVMVSMASPILPERRMKRYMPGVEPISANPIVRAYHREAHHLAGKIVRLIGRRNPLATAKMLETGFPTWRQKVSAIDFGAVRADLGKLERRIAVSAKARAQRT